MSSESRSSSGPNKRRYNVFLSFYAAEIGSFASRLDMALSSESGILVFGEDERFQHGERVKSVLNVIGECEIAIIVFSKKYANSSSCIEELEKITECCRTSDLIVLPVFYDDDEPSYGSLEGDMFGDAFRKFLDRVSMKDILKNEDKLMTWVALISKATAYLGSSDLVHKPMYRYESVYIKDIVEHVKGVVNKRYLFATASVKSSGQDVVQLLNQSKSPLLIGPQFYQKKALQFISFILVKYNLI